MTLLTNCFQKSYEIFTQLYNYTDKCDKPHPHHTHIPATGCYPVRHQADELRAERSKAVKVRHSHIGGLAHMSTDS